MLVFAVNQKLEELKTLEQTIQTQRATWDQDRLTLEQQLADQLDQYDLVILQEARGEVPGADAATLKHQSEVTKAKLKDLDRTIAEQETTWADQRSTLIDEAIAEAFSFIQNDCRAEKTGIEAELMTLKDQMIAKLQALGQVYAMAKAKDGEMHQLFGRLDPVYRENEKAFYAKYPQYRQHLKQSGSVDASSVYEGAPWYMESYWLKKHFHEGVEAYRLQV